MARLRSSLNNHQQPEVFVPVDVRGDCDFDYDGMSVGEKLVSFQSFSYIKAKHRNQDYFLKSFYNEKKQCEPPEEKTEEIKTPEEEILIKENSKKSDKETTKKS